MPERPRDDRDRAERRPPREGAGPRPPRDGARRQPSPDGARRQPSPDGARRQPSPDGAGPKQGGFLAGSERSLDRRWWWHGAVVAIAGAAAIGFQWEVITTGETVALTWVMVVVGAVFVVSGIVLAWRSRPAATAARDTGDEGPRGSSDEGGSGAPPR